MRKRNELVDSSMRKANSSYRVGTNGLTHFKPQFLKKDIYIKTIRNEIITIKCRIFKIVKDGLFILQDIETNQKYYRWLDEMSLTPISIKRRGPRKSSHSQQTIRREDKEKFKPRKFERGVLRTKANILNCPKIKVGDTLYTKIALAHEHGKIDCIKCTLVQCTTTGYILKSATTNRLLLRAASEISLSPINIRSFTKQIKIFKENDTINFFNTYLNKYEQRKIIKIEKDGYLIASNDSARTKLRKILFSQAKPYFKTPNINLVKPVVTVKETKFELEQNFLPIPTLTELYFDFAINLTMSRETAML